MKDILFRWIEAYMARIGGLLFINGTSSAPSTPTNTTTSNSQLPGYAQPYMQNLLGQTAALTDANQNPYVPYAGQIAAGDSSLQQQAYGSLSNMGQPGQQSGWQGGQQQQ